VALEASMTTSKCAHPACECFVAPKGAYGKYCSDECKRAGQITELHCNCQHPECRVPSHAGAPTASRPQP
jgi:hypothetical protein